MILRTLLPKSRKWAFPPELHFSDGTPIEYIADIRFGWCGDEPGPEMSISAQKNTEYICTKARNKLWILRRLLNMDLDIHQLFDVYTEEIRSILEMAVPVLHSGLTNQQTADIESVQKVAIRIILQNKYETYELACETFSF